MEKDTSSKTRDSKSNSIDNSQSHHYCCDVEARCSHCLQFFQKASRRCSCTRKNTNPNPSPGRSSADVSDEPDDRNNQEQDDPKDPDRDDKALNKRLRDIVKEENQLSNNRMTWFLQFQGFLFLSVSGFATKIDPLFRLILAVPGFLSGFSILKALTAAEVAMRKMERLNKHPFPLRGNPNWGGCCCFNPKEALIYLIMAAWGCIFAYTLLIITLAAQELGEENWRYLFIDKFQEDKGPYFNITIKKLVNWATIKKMIMENATNRDINIEQIVLENSTNRDINIENMVLENATNRDITVEHLLNYLHIGAEAAIKNEWENETLYNFSSFLGI